MSQDRGWGYRPVDGKDWGCSLLCDTTVQHELIARLEHALKMEGMLLFVVGWNYFEPTDACIVCLRTFCIYDALYEPLS
jgi:hypothetical protein